MVATYSRDLIETLLPGVWDISYSLGLPRADTAPEPGSPKATTNKSHGNTFWALLADVRTAWVEAPLTRKEKRAVFMRYGLHDEEKYIAAYEQCSQQAISARLLNAVGKLVSHLNGSELIEYDEEGV